MGQKSYEKQESNITMPGKLRQQNPNHRQIDSTHNAV